MIRVLPISLDKLMPILVWSFEEIKATRTNKNMREREIKLSTFFYCPIIEATLY